MTNATWKTVCAAIATIDKPPAWLGELTHKSCEEIARLPKLDNAAKGQTALPVFEEKAVAADYLEFLRGQICLNARGVEWADIFRRRLDALQPFVGKMLLTAHFYQKPHSATLSINPETGKLANAEFF
jgi:hypothetical protein